MEFIFDEENHLYTLGGKPLTGVTTILGVIAKPSLIQWSASMACDFVKDNLKSMDQLEAVLKDARVAHRKKKEASADTGTFVHKMCEVWIADRTQPDDVIFSKAIEALKLKPEEIAEVEKQISRKAKGTAARALFLPIA